MCVSQVKCHETGTKNVFFSPKLNQNSNCDVKLIELLFNNYRFAGGKISLALHIAEVCRVDAYQPQFQFDI